MKLPVLEASIRRLNALASDEPSHNAFALGQALSILNGFRLAPNPTALDRTRVDRAMRGFTMWFDGDWRSLAPDKAAARQKLLDQIRAVERACRARLG
jgi:hypothetical protein